MSKVVDFMFQNLGRIGNDDYSHTQDNIMNNAFSSYNLTNHANLKPRDSFLLQSKYPTMNMNGGAKHVGELGHNVDESTKLLKSELTNLNCKINIQERTYKTVPYLGRGNVDVALENSLRLGDTLKEKKSAIQLGEKNINDLEKYPMQKRLQNMNKANRMIEESASNGWIRGGLPTRDYEKRNH